VLVNIGSQISGKLGRWLGQDFGQNPYDIIVRVILVIEQHGAVVAVLKGELQVGEQFFFFCSRHQVFLSFWFKGK
jgi:hypothetical protein